jgi:hypothetical protein
MGLIILPMMIVWFAACLYTARMGYQLINAHPFVSFGLPLIVITLGCIAAYVYFGLASFKSHKEVWAFEIPLFFMTGKIAIVMFLLAAMTHFFFASNIQNAYLLAGVFIIMMTFSSGALIGAFSSDHFIQAHNIKTTY